MPTRCDECSLLQTEGSLTIDHGPQQVSYCIIIWRRLCRLDSSVTHSAASADIFFHDKGSLQPHTAEGKSFT